MVVRKVAGGNVVGDLRRRRLLIEQALLHFEGKGTTVLSIIAMVHRQLGTPKVIS
jgi:hypothetical protein